MASGVGVLFPPQPAAHNIPSKHREMIALQFIRPPVLKGHHSLVLQLGLDFSMKHFTFTQRTWTDKTKVFLPGIPCASYADFALGSPQIWLTIRPGPTHIKLPVVSAGRRGSRRL
jgi:hypothetical protein